MARVFKRKDRLAAMSEINLTSLMDLVFCLLIIFMIATPLLEQTVPINLPSQSRSPSLDRDKQKFQSVSIDAQGRYFWGKDQVTFDQLKDKLNSLSSDPTPPVIDFRGDGSVAYQKVMDVVTLIKVAGLKQLSLDTQVK